MRWRSLVLLLAVFGLTIVDQHWGEARSNRIRKRPGGRYLQYLHAQPENTRRCGYEGCPVPKPGMLNVHIVPHTHDDVGWLKTVDQYFYGTRARITKVAVQNILDSVVKALLADPQRRFIYVESAFFFKWWRTQSDEVRQQVQQLVREGRLEFIGGAWSMNDEATVHYQSTIDQFSWGLRQLNDTFGECGRPRVGWQIDPFGHSREQASLFAQMGYDGLFIGRLDYQDKTARLLERRPEMLWHGSANLGEAADLFTGVLYNNYGPPAGFCFDILCNDEPIVDAKRSKENNVERRVDEFIAYVQKQSEKYQTNNVIITMGEDFNYVDAEAWYRNLDKLNKYANLRQANGSQVNLFYSTPSCYLKSLHDSNIEWTTKSDDFFPYASDPHTYWTGYFTSRPTLKRFERQGNHFLQVCKQLSVFAPHKTSRSFDFHLNFLRETMGVMQHHDAITGTEQQHVAHDYARLLTIALRACGETVRNVLNQLTTGKTTSQEDAVESAAETVDAHDNIATHPWPKYDFQFDTCYGLNISQCPVTENGSRFVVTVYNPLAHSTHQTIRLPVASSAHYEVRDYRNVPVVSQLVPIANAVREIHYRRSAADTELLFVATELPPLGYKSYFVSRAEPQVQMMSDQPAPPAADAAAAAQPFEIGNQYIKLQFDAAGQLQSIEANGARAQLQQTFFYYEAANGNNEVFANRSSGAYIFRPNSTERSLLPPQGSAVLQRVVRTALVEEVHQQFNGWLSQVIRVHRDERHAEFDWLVGEIPIDDGLGKEVVARFSSDIQSAGVFYTDSNGREMMRRVRDKRDTWNVSIAEPQSANYYPVTARIAVEDELRRLAVLTDRAQGGSSLVDGAIDLMVHRRLLRDDAFGVGEALNETAFGRGVIVRGQHWLTFGSNVVAADRIGQQAQERFLQVAKLLPAWVFVSDASNWTYAEWREKYTNIFSGVTLSLPLNVNLLSLEPWRDGSLLIRFEHLLERLEDPAVYSQAVTFNLHDVLHGLQIAELRETTLAGNQWIGDARRLRFRTKPASSNANPNFAYGRRAPFAAQDNDLDPLQITLQPMQIRTFVIVLEQSE